MRTSAGFAPSSFDANDGSLHAIALHQGMPWDSFAKTVRSCDPKAVMLMTPVFWQLQPLIDEACADVAPVFVNDPANLPLAEAALRAGIDTVIITARDSFAFSSHCASCNIFPRALIVLHEAGARTQDIPLPLVEHVAFLRQEVYGLPVSNGTSV